MKFTTRLIPTVSLIALGWAAGAATGCGEAAPSPTSPVVAADSEEGRKARAEDEADRLLLKQREAKAASRRKNLKIPEEG